MEWWKTFFKPEFYGNSLSDMSRERSLAEADFALAVTQPPDGGRVLDLCCGVGRHLTIIASRGYNAFGLDACAEYLEAAARNAESEGVSVRLVKGDMRRIPIRTPFDAITNFFSSFGYFEDDSENFKVFQSVASRLKPGGCFFLETLNRDYLLTNFIEKDWSNSDGLTTLEDRWFDSRTDTAHCEWTWIRKGIETRHESHVKLYPYTTVERELRNCGMEVFARFGDYDGSDYNFESGRMIVAARKK